jgi:hypothetical protein
MVRADRSQVGNFVSDGWDTKRRQSGKGADDGDFCALVMGNRAHCNSPRFRPLDQIQAHLIGIGTPHSGLMISPFRMRSPLLARRFTDLWAAKSKPTVRGSTSPVALADLLASD